VQKYQYLLIFSINFLWWVKMGQKGCKYMKIRSKGRAYFAINLPKGHLWGFGGGKNG